MTSRDEYARLGRRCSAELARIEELDEPTPDELAVHEFLQQADVDAAKER